MRGIRIAAVMTALLASLPLVAQEMPPLVSVSPLWAGFLRPEGLELQRPEGQGWHFAVGFAYGNTAQYSPEVVYAHDASSGVGSALDTETVNSARELWPTADIFAVDTEVLRFDLEARYSFVSRWEVGIRLPVWKLGGTIADEWPSWLHDAIGVSNNGRDSFPNGQTFIALRPQSGGSWDLTEETSAEILGASLWGARSWGIGENGWHRLWLTVSAPGSDSDAFGEMGWGTGLRWAVGAQSGGVGYYGGVGWTKQGGQAASLGDAADTFHAWLGVSASLGKGWSAEAMFRADGSPFADVDDGKAGRSTGEFAIGLSVALGSQVRWHLALGEDFPGMGMNPDFSIQSSLRFGL